jgi:hypothetical protein
VKLVVEVEDGDDDRASDDHTAIIANSTTSFLSIDDDGPQVTVGGGTGSLSLELDETTDADGDDVVADTADLYNNPAASETVDNNGDLDDVFTVGNTNETPVISTNPSTAAAIGRVTSASTAVSGLFGAAVIDYGSDGAGDLDTDGRKDTLSLVLSAAMVQTNLVVTELEGTSLDGLTDAQRTVWLVPGSSSTEVLGVIAGADGVVGTGGDDYVALRITLSTPGNLSTAAITVNHFLPIDHDASETVSTPENPSLYDESVSMLLSGGTLGVKLVVEVEDGDDDRASDDHTAIIANSTTSFLSIDDDGPQLSGVQTSGGTLNFTPDAVTPAASDTFLWDPGTDGGALAITDFDTPLEMFSSDASSTSMEKLAAWEAIFGTITASTNADNTVLTYYTPDGDDAGTDPDPLFQFVLTDNGGTSDSPDSKWEFFILQSPGVQANDLDFSGFPSGTNVETIILPAFNSSTVATINGLLWNGVTEAAVTAETYDLSDLNNREDRVDGSTPVPTALKQDNLSRDNLGWGVFQDGSSEIETAEGFEVLLNNSIQGFEINIQGIGNADNIGIIVLAEDGMSGSEQTQTVISLPNGAEETTYTLVVDDFAPLFEEDDTLTTLDSFNKLTFMFFYPLEGGDKDNDGDGFEAHAARFNELLVIEQAFLPDAQIDVTFKGTDDDTDMTQTETVSFTIDADMLI